MGCNSDESLSPVTKRTWNWIIGFTVKPFILDVVTGRTFEAGASFRMPEPAGNKDTAYAGMITMQDGQEDDGQPYLLAYYVRKEDGTWSLDEWDLEYDVESIVSNKSNYSLPLKLALLDTYRRRVCDWRAMDMTYCYDALMERYLA